MSRTYKKHPKITIYIFVYPMLLKVMGLKALWTRKSKRPTKAVKGRRVAARTPAGVGQKQIVDQLFALIESRAPIKDVDRALDYSVYTNSPLRHRAPFQLPDGQDAFLGLIQAFFVERPGCASLFLSIYGFERLSDGKTVARSQLKFSRLENSWIKDAPRTNRSDMWHLKNAMNNALVKFSIEYANEKNIKYLKDGVGSAEFCDLFIKFIEKAKTIS